MLRNYSLLFTLLLGAYGVSAQITLTADNYGSRDTVILSDTTFIDNDLFDAPPSSGPDQVWDYSDRTLDEIFTVFVSRPTGEDTCFAGATIVSDIFFDFQGFGYTGLQYEGTDETGRYILGSKVEEAKFSLLQVTGNASDTLAFPDAISRASQPHINFPATFGDSFTTTINTEGKFNLTVAAFGLNNTPGSRDIASVFYQDVIGYGMLTLPQPDGTITEPLEALLVRDSLVSTTTYSLGGAPAPAALLGAFGLVDTTVSSRVIFYFHVKGRARSAARFTPQSGADQGKYALVSRRVPAGTTTGVRNHDLLDLTLYPNPVSRGGSIKLSGETAMTAGAMRLLDLQGRVINESSFRGLSGESPELYVPTSARPGLYFYQLVDHLGRPIGAGKVMVR